MKNETNQNIIQKWPERLVLVRHGQSIYNEERELVNRGVIKTYTVNVKGVRGSDFPLSAKGEKQAKKVAILLKKEFKKFDIVFTSPFKRAHDTARIIAKKLPKTRFVIEERIREKEFGIADGMTPAEMKELFPYEYARKQKQKNIIIGR